MQRGAGVQGAPGATICAGPSDALPAEDEWESMERGSGYPGLMLEGGGSEWLVFSEMGKVSVTTDRFWENPGQLQTSSSRSENDTSSSSSSTRGHLALTHIQLAWKAPLGCGNSGGFLFIQPTAHQWLAQHFQRDYSLVVTQRIWENPSTSSALDC